MSRPERIVERVTEQPIIVNISPAEQNTEPLPVAQPQPIHVTVMQPEQRPERISDVPTYSQVLPPERTRTRPEVERKTIQPTNRNNSPNNSETIHSEHEKGIKNNSPDEQKTAPETVPEPNKTNDLATPPFTSGVGNTIPAYKKKGKIGRQRKYDELGLDDVEPIKEVVLFRHHLGRHWPGLSRDMELYYDRFYFEKPNKRKDQKDYAKHVKCWERREQWINGKSDTTEAT
jgi:hypothetical protein